MKRLNSVETEQYSLEVIECDCGYHMGIDASFLDQVKDFITRCPSCDKEIDTAKVVPENESPPECKRCGTDLDKKGYCKDETCPHSDHLQNETWVEG